MSFAPSRLSALGAALALAAALAAPAAHAAALPLQHDQTTLADVPNDGVIAPGDVLTIARQLKNTGPVDHHGAAGDALLCDVTGVTGHAGQLDLDVPGHRRGRDRSRTPRRSPCRCRRRLPCGTPINLTLTVGERGQLRVGATEHRHRRHRPAGRPMPAVPSGDRRRHADHPSAARGALLGGHGIRGRGWPRARRRGHHRREPAPQHQPRRTEPQVAHRDRRSARQLRSGRAGRQLREHRAAGGRELAGHGTLALHGSVPGRRQPLAVCRGGTAGSLAARRQQHIPSRDRPGSTAGR